jgi:mono/diheme cytochrome c family protein
MLFVNLTQRNQRSAMSPNRPYRIMAGTALPAALAVVALLGPGCGSKSGTLESATASSVGLPSGKATLTQVERGRYLVITGGCSDCHNRGVLDPTDAHWLAGYIPNPPAEQGKFQVGPWTTYAANITSDPTTGLGQYTDQQVYNALKFGLDPGKTPDAVISSTTPGQGNFPSTPYYLAPPMPWPSIRQSTDADLWAIVAYLKHGTRAVNNVVPEIAGPPTTFASSYVGVYTPIPDFPATSEVFNP